MSVAHLRHGVADPRFALATFLLHFFGRISLIILLAIWVAYPLVVGALSLMRPRRRAATTTFPDVPRISVVLATRANADAIRARVANLREASYDGRVVEVIVALDASGSEASPDDLAGLEAHVVIGDRPGGKAATLNAGVRAAHHEILIFADTAQTFDTQAFTEMVFALADPRVGAVSGSLHTSPHGASNLAAWYWRYERRVRHAEARLHSPIGVTGAIYALKRALWEPLPAELILDDLYVPMSLVLKGWRVGFTERARAVDARQFTATQEFRRKVRTLTGVLQLCVWLPGVLNPLRNPVWLQFIFHKLLRLATPYLVTIVAVDALWAIGRRLLSADATIPLVALMVLCVTALTFSRVRRTVARHLAWGFALQASVVVAMVNGFRGRWDVWRS